MLLNFEDIISRNTPQKKTEKIEKLFSQPKDLFEAVDFSNFGVINEESSQMPTFIEGERYSLKGVSCDGFKMEEKIYELVKVVDDFYGSPLNSVIVKQVSGEKGIIFTLSKNDCAHHGIEYENGLQLFPKSLPWTRVKEKVQFDAHNLATTPLSDIDNTIRYIAFRLDGFKDYSDGYILTPSGHLITETHFIDTLRVATIEPIVYGNGYVINDKTCVNHRLIIPKNVLFNHGNFISSEDTIFLMIHLKRPYAKRDEYFSSIDGYFGVEPKYLEGINPNDFFTISWDELAAPTIEEYELLKSEKARREAERIKKKEEEEKKRILIEEAKIKERRKNVEKALENMRNYHMNIPEFPKCPKFDFNGTVSSVNMISNTMDSYFDTLSQSLTVINEDLDTLMKMAFSVNEPKDFNPSKIVKPFLLPIFTL